MKLKRARLADDLNEKIALRPGPLELVEKNILPVDSAVKEAIKGSGANGMLLCALRSGAAVPRHAGPWGRGSLPRRDSCCELPFGNVLHDWSS